METLSKKIGKFIHEYRIQKNTSINSISAKTKLNISRIIEIESGNTDIYLYELEKIAKILNISVIEIFKKNKL